MQYKQCALRTGHANYVSKFTVSYFLILRGSLVVEVDSKIYTQQLCQDLLHVKVTVLTKALKSNFAVQD